MTEVEEETGGAGEGPDLTVMTEEVVDLQTGDTVAITVMKGGIVTSEVVEEVPGLQAMTEIGEGEVNVIGSMIVEIEADLQNKEKGAMTNKAEAGHLNRKRTLTQKEAKDRDQTAIKSILNPTEDPKVQGTTGIRQDKMQKKTFHMVKRCNSAKLTMTIFSATRFKRNLMKFRTKRNETNFH
jgi:hypothetical protein